MFYIGIEVYVVFRLVCGAYLTHSNIYPLARYGRHSVLLCHPAPPCNELVHIKC